MGNIAIFNQKGGVGKTTTALNLAGAYQQNKQSVALLDMDPQAHLTGIHRGLALDLQKNMFQFYQADKPLSQLLQPVDTDIQLIASNAELIKLDSHFGRGPTILKKLQSGLHTLSQQSPDLHVIVDCCPYIGVIALNAIFASDLIIIPVSSDYFSVQSAAKVDKALRALEPVMKRRVLRRYLLTRADKRKKMTHEVEQEMRTLFAGEVLETRISENIALAESPRHGKNVFAYDAHSPGARDYLALYEELQAALASTVI